MQECVIDNLGLSIFALKLTASVLYSVSQVIKHNRPDKNSQGFKDYFCRTGLVLVFEAIL